MAPAIEVRDLVVDRGRRRVLDGLSLSVAAGRVTGLLGPSGGGKTTLMRAIVGVQRIVAGDAVVLGLPAGDRRLRGRVGYMTQAPSVYGDLTVDANLRFFARVLGAGPGEAARVARVVGLEDTGGQRVDDLSGGQRARASLAAALLGAPELLVLDEPTVGLDPVLRRDLWATFRRLAGEGVTLLVSSHVMDEAAHCDELVLVRDGAVVASGSPGELLARTQAPDMERAFLALVEGAEAAA